MTSHLFLAQIGPVQSFIAQARRTQDLYVGSQILSNLAVAAVHAAIRLDGFKPIFPFVENGEIYGGTSSHVFAFIATSDPREIAHHLQAALTAYWMEYYALPVRRELQRILGGGDWVKTFDRQAEPFKTDSSSGWMEFYWVALAYDATRHGEIYGQARRALSQRKMLRHFPQVEEPGIKCTLTGAQSALNLDWAKVRRGNPKIGDIVLRPNENLGTLALIKRLAQIVNPDETVLRFPPTDAIAADDPNLREDASIDTQGREVEGYLAVLHMDGDNMGKTLSGLTTLSLHQDFSKALAHFSSNVAPQVVKDHGGRAGRLVYAGGDDVLVLLSLKHALNCADALQRAFKSTIKSQMKMEMTASAGIAITPSNLPLDRALEMARKAEAIAKDHYGRDAIAIAEAHGSSGLRETGTKWDKLAHIHALQAVFANKQVSSKLGFDLREIAYAMQGGAVTRSMREAEMRRVLKRRSNEVLKDEDRKQVVQIVGDAVMMIAEDGHIPNPQWDEAANWAILARFLASGGKREG